MGAVLAPRRLVALLGAILFAAAGFGMGSMNVGWFGLERNANRFFPLLGLGAALVVAGLSGTAMAQRLKREGVLGFASRYLLVLAPVVYLVSWLIEFAILGTLALAIGLICLAIVVVRGHWLHPAERVMIGVSALLTLTWNTETPTAFLLVGVGLIWAVLAVRPLAVSAINGGMSQTSTV